MKTAKILSLLAALCASALFFGCTRYDPYTGQQQIDPGATAGVAGLALGAAALGVAASRRDEPDVVVVNPRPYYRPYYRPPAYRPPHYYHGGRRPYYGGRGYYRR